jgi:hypothetical protein
MAMCRSIITLRGTDPPATMTEFEKAALQYVRKVSGYRVPSKANEEVFNQAVSEIAMATEHLLGHLAAPKASVA